jgi:hypothetical protein
MSQSTREGRRAVRRELEGSVELSQSTREGRAVRRELEEAWRRGGWLVMWRDGVRREILCKY